MSEARDLPGKLPPGPRCITNTSSKEERIIRAQENKMTEQEIPADLYYAVYDQLEYDKDPGCGEETISIIELVRDHYQAKPPAKE